MQCYNHPDIGAVIFCQVCSKGLCRGCADQFNKPICFHCARKEDEAELDNLKASLKFVKQAYTKERISLIWGISLILGGAIYALFFSTPQALPIIQVLFILAVLPWFIGIARTKNKAQQNDDPYLAEMYRIRRAIFWQSPNALQGMLFYYFFKFVLACLLISLATFVAPIIMIFIGVSLFKLKKKQEELEKLVQGNTGLFR